MSTEIKIQNRQGHTIAGTWESASGSTSEPGPAVLLCQGLSGVRNLVLPEVAEALAKAGISSLRFDYAGCGDSEGEPGWINLFQRTDDAHFALTWLMSQDTVDADRVGVYGHSYGGPVAIATAANDTRVRALVAVSSPGSGQDLLRAARPAWDWVALRHRVDAEREAIAGGAAPTVVSIEEIFPFSPKFRAAYEKLKASQGGTSATPGASGLGKTDFYLSTVDLMCTHRVEPFAAQLAHCASLLINGVDDDTAPIEILQPVFDAIPGPKRWHLVPNADHNTLDSGPGLARALPHVTRWFESELAQW